ncbi:MAG: enoyl-CoA hydratase/isomerase family protein [Ilumatobacteraceae bacterium]
MTESEVPSNEEIFETLEVTVDGTIGRLELARPDSLNSLSRRTLQDLAEAARWFDAHRSVKVVVVSGAGRAFCAGFDLGDFSTPDPEWSTRETADLGRLMAEAVTDMRALTIASIHGHCVGGGLVLAASCDLRIAAADAIFSIPEVDLGIPLAWGGIPRLVREIGPAATKELVLTCRRFGPDEARALGFVNAVVPHDELGGHVDALAALLAAKPGYALRTTKQQVNAVTEEIAGTRRNASDADALVFATHDAESRAASASYLASKKKSGRQS